jgi:hypothetical protein
MSKPRFASSYLLEYTELIRPDIRRPGLCPTGSKNFFISECSEKAMLLQYLIKNHTMKTYGE